MGRYILLKTCWILTKYLLSWISPKTGKNELMNELTSTIPILSENKALEYYMLTITASEVGSRTFLITCEDLFLASCKL